MNTTISLVVFIAVEQKSKFTLVERVPDRQSDQVAKAKIRLMRPYKDNAFTITSDNAKEFSQYKKISKA